MSYFAIIYRKDVEAKVTPTSTNKNKKMRMGYKIQKKSRQKVQKRALLRKESLKSKRKR